MPEGDTIARLAGKIADRFGSKTVTRSVFRHPRLATVDLTGSVLESTESHGKHLFLNWSDGRTLHVHLLMQGRIRFGTAVGTETWRRRFELDFDSGRLTGVDVPLVHLVPRGAAADMAAHLGPDLCGRFDPAVALARLSADVGRPLGAALTRTNARLGPQNTTGRRLADSDHHILSGRTRLCPRCGARLERRRGEQTPWRRRTAWCPGCQRDGNDAVDVDRVRDLLSLHPARRLLTVGPDEVVYSGDLDPVAIDRRGRHRPSFL